MPPISLAPVSGRYLSFAEREEIAIWRAQQVAADHNAAPAESRQVLRAP